MFEGVRWSIGLDSFTEALLAFHKGTSTLFTLNLSPVVP